MFEVRCLVADKRLADVLRALRKLTLEPPVTIAVDDADVSSDLTKVTVNPKHIRLATGDGFKSARKIVEEYVLHEIKNGARIITAKQLGQHMFEHNFSSHSYSYPLSLLVKQKVLKTTKELGTYEVVK